MIDGTEKPKISLKFAKRAARYNKFAVSLPEGTDLGTCYAKINSTISNMSQWGFSISIYNQLQKAEKS